MLKDERISKFEIRSEYSEGPAKKDWLFMLSSYMIVLRPKGMFCKDAIEYVKISPLFEI